MSVSRADDAPHYKRDTIKMHTLPSVPERKSAESRISTPAHAQQREVTLSPTQTRSRETSASPTRAQTPRFSSATFHRTPATMSMGSADSYHTTHSSKVLITQSSDDECDDVTARNDQSPFDSDDDSVGHTSVDEMIRDKGPDITNDNGYDTDLDTDDWDFLKEETDHDTSGVNNYIQMCNRLGVIPVSYFMRNVERNTFVMRYHGLGPLGAKAISKPLESNTQIERLDLEGNCIECDGAKYLARTMKDNLYITELILCENGIGSEGALAICTAVRDSTLLKHLDLSGNELRDVDGEIFANLLLRNTHLHSLILRHNRFAAFAAKAFKEAMSENSTLKLLDLSWNEFRLQGALQIADLIKENYGLHHLKVAMNGFGFDGSQAVGVALRHNRSILHLDLSYNRIPDDGAYELARGLKINDSLCTLDLSNNPITNTGALALLIGIKDNLEHTQMYELNISSVLVDEHFEDIHKEIEVHKVLHIKHGGLIGKTYIFEEPPELDPLEAYENMPMTKLKRYVNEAQLTMKDVFKQFDKDVDWSLSYQEFKKGIRDAQIKISDRELDELIHELDMDGDGRIDFGEWLQGNKSNRDEKLKVHEYLAKLEAGEIERPEKLPKHPLEKIAHLLGNVEDPNTISNAT